jgi:hypothetical protein
MHSFCEQLTNDIRISRKGNGAFRWSAIWATAPAYSCPGVCSMLREGPATSYERRCACLRLVTAMCLRILHDVLLWTKISLSWFCTFPTGIKNRMECNFFGTAQNFEERGTERIQLCSNKRWVMVYFEYLYAAIWVPSRDAIPEKNQTKIDIESVWFRLFGTSTESTGCWVYPKVLHLKEHFCHSVVFDLAESIYAHSRTKILKGIMMHLNNAFLQHSRKSTECLE